MTEYVVIAKGAEKVVTLDRQRAERKARQLQRRKVPSIIVQRERVTQTQK